jgi:oligosaccharide reducing-end xylanase
VDQERGADPYSRYASPMMRQCSVAGLLALAVASCGQTTDVVGQQPAKSSVPSEDALATRIGVPPGDSERAIRDAFEQLFFGEPDSQAVYREVGADAAYLEDVANNDVRTDSIGYGMFVTVQLGRRDVFDKLWTWAKRYMLFAEAPRAGLLSWRCSTLGDACETVAATDAMSFIATSLLLADTRWGGAGAHPYSADANMLIDALLQTETRNGGIVDNVRNPFDIDSMLPRRTSPASDDDYLQTDYLMPAFYDYWSTRRPGDAAFWRDAARLSSRTLEAAPISDTGLIPLLIDADGAPAPTENYYNEVSARTLLNRWFCQAWMGSQAWVPVQNARLLDFFLEQGDYVSSYFLDGRVRGDRNTPAHLALVATAAAQSAEPTRHNDFLRALVEQDIPEGEERYYDGMLYLISLLAVSGNIVR